MESSTGDLDVWPNVAVVVPARNEADVIERTLSSLADQDYPGSMFIYLVDDNYCVFFLSSSYLLMDHFLVHFFIRDFLTFDP